MAAPTHFHSKETAMMINRQAAGSMIAACALLLGGCGFEVRDAQRPAIDAPAPTLSPRAVALGAAATEADVEGPLEILPDLGS
jgi:hypothetical protein